MFLFCCQYKYEISISYFYFTGVFLQNVAAQEPHATPVDSQSEDGEKDSFN
jgi:hypothetical protein